jgi:hypothetical protein
MFRRSNREVRNVNKWRPAVALCLVLSFRLLITAQNESNVWHRAYTGEESIIELNVSTLKFDDARVLRMDLRTVLVTPETLNERPGTKYKTRLETVEFNLGRNEYRLTRVALLEPGGKTVDSYENLTGQWKPIRAGGMMNRLLYAARTFLPFGSWRVVSFRFVDGPIPDQDDRALDVSRLIGATVSLEAEHAKVEASVCKAPVYKSDRLSMQEFSRRLGVAVQLPEIKSDHVETISVKCDTDGWTPRQSLLVELPEGGILMLWKGVFLVLKKD